MPEIRNFEVTAGTLRKGDKIDTFKTLRNVTFEAIIKNAPVWMIIAVREADSTSLTPVQVRVRRDEPLTVSREVKTEAEEVAERVALTVESVNGFLDSWITGPLPRLEKIVAKATEHPDYLEVLTHWDVDELLKSQAQRKIALVIRDLATRDLPMFADDTNNDERMLTAVAYTIWSTKKELATKLRYRDPLSRSTSITANLVEDLDQWAYAEFLDKIQWNLYRSAIITERIARIEELDSKDR